MNNIKMNQLQKAQLAILQLHSARTIEWNIVVRWMNRRTDPDDDASDRVARAQRAIRRLNTDNYNALVDWMNSIQ